MEMMAGLSLCLSLSVSVAGWLLAGTCGTSPRDLNCTVLYGVLSCMDYCTVTGVRMYYVCMYSKWTR